MEVTQDLVELISKKDVIDQFVYEYRLKGSLEQKFLGLIAESIRQVISKNAQDFGKPTSTAKLSALFKSLRALFPDDCDFDEKYSVRDILDRMTVVGDLQSLPNGEWWPIMVRFLQLPRTHETVLLGGVPTSEVELIIGKEIRSQGVCRYISSNNVQPRSAIQLDWQTLDSWFGESRRDLRHKSINFLESTKKKMTKVSLEDEEVWIFTREQFSKTKHPHWLPIKNLKQPKFTHSLVRIDVGPIQSSYAIASIKLNRHKDGWCIDRLLSIDHDQASILKYGFGSLFGDGLPVKIVSHKNGIKFSIRYSLPKIESKILSFAIPLRATQTYWREYDLPRSVGPILDEIVSRLGLMVITDNEGETI